MYPSINQIYEMAAESETIDTWMLLCFIYVSFNFCRETTLLFLVFLLLQDMAKWRKEKTEKRRKTEK